MSTNIHAGGYKDSNSGLNCPKLFPRTINVKVAISITTKIFFYLVYTKDFILLVFDGNETFLNGL